MPEELVCTLWYRKASDIGIAELTNLLFEKPLVFEISGDPSFVRVASLLLHYIKGQEKILRFSQVYAGHDFFTPQKDR